jgi:hypothetical protein
MMLEQNTDCSGCSTAQHSTARRTDVKPQPVHDTLELSWPRNNAPIRERSGSVADAGAAWLVRVAVVALVALFAFGGSPSQPVVF